MNTNFKEKATHGMKWFTLQALASKGIGFLTFILLARILSPVEFGTVAAVAVVISLCELAFEQGFGDALVQKKAVSSDMINSVFTFNLVAALVLWLIVLAATPWIADLFSAREQTRNMLLDITPIAALQLFPSAAAVCQLALLRRKMEFRWLSIRTVVSQVTGAVVAIGVAMAGYGVWALVAQGLTANIMSTGLLWVKPQFSPRLMISVPALRSMLSFSTGMLGLQILGFCRGRLIDAWIAGFFGSLTLGVFAVGNRFQQTAWELISNVTNNIGLPIASRIKDAQGDLSLSYIQAFSRVAAVVPVVFVMLFVLAPELITLGLGEQWKDSVFVLRCVSWFGLFQALNIVNSVTLNALGLTQLTLRLEALRVAALIAGLAIGSTVGFKGAMVGFVCGYIIATPYVFSVALRYAQVSWGAVVRAAVLPLFAVLFAIVVTLILESGSIPFSHWKLTAIKAVLAMLALSLPVAQLYLKRKPRAVPI